MDEFKFNQNQSEVNKQTEFTGNSEFKPVVEAAAVDEIKTVNEFEAVPTKKSINKVKKNKALSVMTGSMVAIIGAATLGITNMVNVLLNAEFNEVNYQDGVISYSINVKNLTEKEELHLSYYAFNELVETSSILDEDQDAVITGEIAIDPEALANKLAEGENVTASYRLSLSANVGLNVERKFDSYLVKIDKCTSKFEEVTGYCTCGVDGYFKFTMNFQDDFGLFSEFEAYIIDSDGTKSECEFNDDLHSEQRIWVRSLKSSGKLYVKYLVDGEENKQEIVIDVKF